MTDPSFRPVDRYRRTLIALGTQHYREESELTKVPEHLERVVRVFTSLGYSTALDELRLDPPLNSLRVGLGEWLTSSQRTDEDIVVIYYTGHGANEAAGHYLLTTDTRPGKYAHTALRSDFFAEALGNEPRVRRLLVILDTCYSGAGALNIAALAQRMLPNQMPRGPERGIWVVVSAYPHEEAQQAVFIDAFEKALSEALEAVSPRQPYLGLSELIVQTNKLVSNSNPGQHVGIMSATLASELPPFLRNPRIEQRFPGLDLETAARLRAADITSYWGPIARGVAAEGQGGWYFTGRNAARQTLVKWLSHPSTNDRLCVLSGGPGSGKSALLGFLVLTASDEYRAMLPERYLDGRLIAPVGQIDAAILARGKTPSSIVEELAAALKLAASSDDELVEQLGQRERAATVVIDALDEAADPQQVIDEVVHKLLAGNDTSHVRLLIGTRKHLLPNLPQPRLEIDLDDPAYFEAKDIESYVRSVLVAEDSLASKSPYRDRSDLAKPVAAVVAERAGQSFLIARVVARGLTKDSRPLSAEEVMAASHHWSSVGDAFEADLARHGKADKLRLRDVLRPLAWAEGAGMPWENLWAPLASALADDITYTNDDIRQVQQQAGGYIVEDQEQDRSVFRLYHKEFADHLRGDRDPGSVQATITAELLEQVGGDRAHPQWLAAHPYIRTHLATHAAAAGKLGRLLSDPAFLLAVDPERLLRATRRTKLKRHDYQAVDTYRSALPQLRGRALPEAAAYLQLAAHQQGNDGLVKRIDELGLPLPWSVAWARFAAAYPRWTIGSHSSRIDAIAIAKLNGRPVAITAGDKDAVWVWDLVSGTQVRKLATGRSSWTTAVAVGEVDGRPVVVAADHSRVWVWDLASGTQLHCLAHSDMVRAVAIAEVGGRAVAVTGGDDHAVQVWDLASGTRLHQLPGHTGTIRALATAELDAHTVAITGDDHAVRVWDLVSGKQLDPPLHKHRWSLRLGQLRFRDRTVLINPAGRVAVTELDGRTIAIATIGDRTVRVWDLASHTQLHKLTGHTGAVNAVAVARLGDDRPVAVTAGSDPVVRVWDLASGTQLRQLTDFPGWYMKLNGWVRTLAVGEVDGRPVAITGGEDPTVRVWDLASGTRLHRLTGHDYAVNAVAVAELDDRSVAISGGDDGTVRIWDLGRETTNASGALSWVNAVAVAELNGRSVAITGGSDETVRIWDLASGTQLRMLTGGTDYIGSVHAIAVAELDGRSVAITGSIGLGKDDSYARVWDLASGTQLRRLSRRTRSIKAVAVGKVNGRPVMVTVGKGNGVDKDQTARVWDLASGTQLHELTGHTESVSAVAVGEVGGRPVAVTGSADTTVRVWDLASGTQLHELTGHTKSVYAVAVGEVDGRPVAVTGGFDQTVRVWDLIQVRELVTVTADAAVRAVASGPQHIIAGTSEGVLVLRLHPSATE